MVRELRAKSATGQYLDKGMNVLTDLLQNNGIYDCSVYRSGIFYGFTDLRYYPGRRILAAWQRRLAQSMLTAREMQTLDAALRIADRAQGSDLARERAIHDALCGLIVYYSDEDPHNDDDCAIGALLDGKANCDGYADAFYLCAGLAGLRVRHQFGTVREAPEDAQGQNGDGSHMWDLVYIDGQWLVTDVTWGDRKGGGISYVYFNLGADEAAQTYIWDPQALREEPADSAAGDVRGPGLERIRVSGWQDAVEAVDAASRIRSSRICMTCPPGMDLDENAERLFRILYSRGIEDFSWNCSPSAVEIYEIRYHECFAIIDDLRDLPACLRSAAENGHRSFRLYFPPERFADLFEDDCSRLIYLFASADVADPSGFMYTPAYGLVVFKDLSVFPDSENWERCRITDIEDVRKAASAFAAARGARLAIDYAGGIDLYENHSLLQRALRDAGIRSFDWHFYNGIVRIDNVLY